MSGYDFLCPDCQEDPCEKHRTPPASPVGLEPGDIITNSLSEPVGFTNHAVMVLLAQRERETVERIVKMIWKNAEKMKDHHGYPSERGYAWLDCAESIEAEWGKR